MKVIIAGDRELDESDLKLVEDAVKASGFKVTTVFSGAAKGGDKLGEKWAAKNKKKIQQFRADWKDLEAPGAIIKEGPYGKYNAMAGFMRNQIMAEQADGLIALQPLGNSNGTQDMIKRAKEQGIPVFVWPEQKEAEVAYTF